MSHMKNSAMWEKMESYLEKFNDKKEGKEVIRLVAELRQGGRLNGGDIVNLREIIKQAWQGGGSNDSLKGKE